MKNIMDEETIKDLKTQRMTDLIEQVLIDTALLEPSTLAECRSAAWFDAGRTA